VSDVNNIYFTWIQAHKKIVRNEPSKDPASPKTENFLEISNKTIQKLIENLVEIIFDPRTFPHFILVVLEQLKIYIDQFIRMTYQAPFKDNINILSKILHKIVLQIKIVKSNHLEII